MRKGIIYKITNNYNGNSYIGKTIRDLDKRWKQHITDSKKVNNKTALGRAIVKYGKEGFSLEVIEKGIPELELSDKEVYWISYFNTFKGKGYNCTLGVDGVSGCTSWNAGKTGVYSEETLDKMKKAKLGTTPTNLEQLRLLAIERTGSKHHNSKKANIYDYKTNELIAEKVAITEWCRDNGYNQGNLCATARGTAKQHKGIYAKYVEESISLELPIYWEQEFVTKKSKFHLIGLNQLFSMHYQVRNKLKQHFHYLVANQVNNRQEVPNKFKVHYKLYYKNIVSDPSNIIAGIEKVLLDGLQECGIIKEDNVLHHLGTTWEVVEQDKVAPRCEITIIPIGEQGE